MSPLARLMLLVAGTLTAAACTMEPRYHQPALPTPMEWPIPPTVVPVAAPAGTPAAALNGPAAPRFPDAGALGGTKSAVDIGWRDFFADPHLQAIIAQALANNRDLRVAVLNIQAAHSQYVVQRANLFPQFSGNASYVKEHLPTAEYGFPITTAFNTVGVALTSFEIDLFGHERSLTHAAYQQYLQQSEARRSTQLSLIAQVAQAYLTLLSDRQLLQLAQDTLKSQQASYDITVKEHDSGQVSGLDVAQAQSTVEQARADLARYDGNIAQDIDALNLLVGAPVDATSLPSALDDKIVGVRALPPDLPSSVLLRRPDVLQAEHALLSANANIGAARAAFFPTISLTGNVGSVSQKLSNLFSSGTNAWTYTTPQITMPLFQGGSVVGGLDLSHVNRDVALAQYEKAIQSAFREVADGLALTGTLERQREAQEALVGADGRAYELSQQRYKVGRDSYLAVLTSQRDYYSAQQGLIATQLAQQNNRVTLYKALGGGWQETSR
jgi:outer membrane protein, multidrug efflux system